MLCNYCIIEAKIPLWCSSDMYCTICMHEQTDRSMRITALQKQMGASFLAVPCLKVASGFTLRRYEQQNYQICSMYGRCIAS